MEPLAQLSQLGPLLGDVVAHVTDDQLDRPTPCVEYSVRGVLEHMIGGATAFAAAYRGETAHEPDLDDVLAGFGPALEDLGAAMSAPGALDRTVAAPFGELPGDVFARFVMLDGLVVVGGGLSGAASLFLPALVGELNGGLALLSGERVPRLEIRAFNLEDEQDQRAFLADPSRQVRVPDI